INVGVLERAGESGTMRALGNPSWDVMRVVIMEGTLLGMIGALVERCAWHRPGAADFEDRHADAAAAELQSRVHGLDPSRALGRRRRVLGWAIRHRLRFGGPCSPCLAPGDRRGAASHRLSFFPGSIVAGERQYLSARS